MTTCTQLTQYINDLCYLNGLPEIQFVASEDNDKVTDKTIVSVLDKDSNIMISDGQLHDVLYSALFVQYSLNCTAESKMNELYRVTVANFREMGIKQFYALLTVSHKEQDVLFYCIVYIPNEHWDTPTEYIIESLTNHKPIQCLNYKDDGYTFTDAVKVLREYADVITHLLLGETFAYETTTSD